MWKILCVGKYTKYMYTKIQQIVYVEEFAHLYQGTESPATYSLVDPL